MKKKRTAFQKPGHYTAKDRKKIPKTSFAGGHKSFPIVTQKDVYDASKLAGHAPNPAKVRSKIKSIAKRKGFKLPKSWSKKTK